MDSDPTARGLPGRCASSLFFYIRTLFSAIHTFVTLSPTFLLPFGQEEEFPPSGTEARVDDTPSGIDKILIDGEEVNILFTQFGDEITGHPTFSGGGSVSN